MGKTEHFKDCDTCPEIVVVPAGSFTMGSPKTVLGRWPDPDEAQTRVSIARPFAVGKFAVTFDEWDACVAEGGCNGYEPADIMGRGRGKQPVINAAWLSHKTGKIYRLLSEAEREYVTRAGTATPFWWGSTINPNQANYDTTKLYRGGGSTGQYRNSALPVATVSNPTRGVFTMFMASFFEWTEDCWNESNLGNPGDGCARITGDCNNRAVRGGTWP